ncbi:MAG: AtpZ/AtpI family protein [Planctomycetota bacterium]
MTEPTPGDGPPRKNALGRMRDRFFGLGPKRRDEPPRPRRLSPEQTRLATAGLELAGGILLFAAAGYGLDRLLGTDPVLLIALAVLGMVGGLYRLIRAAQPPSK